MWSAARAALLGESSIVVTNRLEETKGLAGKILKGWTVKGGIEYWYNFGAHLNILSPEQSRGRCDEAIAYDCARHEFDPINPRTGVYLCVNWS